MDTTTNLSRNILSLINLNLNALIREPLIHSLANTKEMAFRDAFLLNISNDPYVAIESAQDAYSSLRIVAGSPEIANEYAAKILSMFCLQFSRWEEGRSRGTQAGLAKDAFLRECAHGILMLLGAFRLGKKPMSLLTSAWPSLMTWTMHIYEDVYPHEDPKKQALWREPLLNACAIATQACVVPSTAAKLSRMLAELWIGVEDSRVSRALWVCCGSQGSIPDPTHYLTELCLSSDKVVEIALQRLVRTSEDNMRNPQPAMWDDLVSLIYGCSALFNSPDPAFGAAMLRKNAFSLMTKTIRNYRVHDASPTQCRERCIFRINALNALLECLLNNFCSNNGLLSLCQSLRKGLVEVMVTTLLSTSRIDEDQRNAAGKVRRALFQGIAQFLTHKSVVSAAGEGMSYFKHGTMRKLSASDLQCEWSEFEQLLLERFVLYRMNCYLRQTDEYHCSNVDCGVVRSGAQMLKCANCKKTLYCSRVCQKEHWHEDGHKQSCVKTPFNRWNVRFLQTVASNAVIRHQPGLHELATKRGISPRHIAFIVTYTFSGIDIDVTDLRDTSTWKANYERYFKQALEEAEEKLIHPPVMVVEVRFKLGTSDDTEDSFTHFMFSERFPTHESFSRFDYCVRKRSNARSSDGEVLESCHNQLNSIVDSVRETMQVEGPRLDQGFWSKEIVDSCVKGVDQKYGSKRDIIGHYMYYIDSFKAFLK